MIKQIPGSAAASLFSGWEETLIWSALEGIMGSCHALTDKNPASAVVVQGDFFFYAGKPEPELVSFIPDDWDGGCRLLAPGSADWEACIKGVYGALAEREIRYATRKEPDIFSQVHLLEAVCGASVPILPIDEALYRQCFREDWSRDLVSRYPTWELFSRLALGFVAVQDGEMLSGASCYCTYSAGIEIEIDTHPQHRRRGFAYACGAKLILACLQRGLYPSWDAANLTSLALAQKLGYRFSHEYPVYYLPGNKARV